MKKLLLLLSLMGALAFTAAPVLLLPGCQTSQTTKNYQSLASVGKTTDTAVKSYLDLVVTGKVATNAVPAVMRSYTLFQAQFNQALVEAQGTNNVQATPELMNLSQTVISNIESSKGTK